MLLGLLPVLSCRGFSVLRSGFCRETMKDHFFCVTAFLWSFYDEIPTGACIAPITNFSTLLLIYERTHVILPGV